MEIGDIVIKAVMADPECQARIGQIVKDYIMSDEFAQDIRDKLKATLDEMDTETFSDAIWEKVTDAIQKAKLGDFLAALVKPKGK